MSNKEIEQLAWDLVDYYDSTNFYDFIDNYDSKEEAYEDVLEALYNGTYEGMIESLSEDVENNELNGITDEEFHKLYGDVKKPEELITRIEEVTKVELEEEKATFSAVDFEKNIPHEMRFKETYSVNDGKDLYWVTQEYFTVGDLKKFADAFKKQDRFNQAYITVRDLSGYDFNSDLANNRLAIIDKEGNIAAQDYIDTCNEEGLFDPEVGYKMEEDCTQASAIQGPTKVFSDEDKLEESKSDIVTSDDLNDEVNYEITLKDGSKRNVKCFWSENNEVTEEDIEEGEDPEDYSSIYYDIYKDGKEIDGGIMITKEDTFDAIELCKDLVAMNGYPDDIEVVRLENGSDAFKIEENKKITEDTEYVSKYDELDDLLNIYAGIDNGKLELYNAFNNNSMKEFDDDEYDMWLEDMKNEHFDELMTYLKEKDEETSYYMSKINESKKDNTDKKEDRYIVYDYAETDNYDPEDMEDSQFTIYDTKHDNFYYDEKLNNPVFTTREEAEEYLKVNKLNENKKIEEARGDAIAEKYNIKDHLDKLEKDLKNIEGVTEVDFDLDGYLDGINAPITVVSYDIKADNAIEYYKQKSDILNAINNVFIDNGVTIEFDEFEDNDTYFYLVSYNTNW